jgi:hypothetical protein
MDTRYGGAAQWLTDHGLAAEELDLLRAKLRRPLPTGSRHRYQPDRGIVTNSTVASLST